MKKLYEDINRQKEIMNIINLSDLSNSWSPDTVLRRKEGKDMYQIKNHKLIKLKSEPTRKDVYYSGKPKEVYYLTDDEVININEILNRISEYKSKIENLENQIESIVGSNKK